MNQRCFVVLFVFLIGAVSAEEPLRFNRDIRPILSQHCFQCHGPDANQRKSDLRLDTEEGLRAAFAAGQLSKSEAWERIQSTAPETVMPPPEGKSLTAKQKKLIASWVKQGAKWEGHWAFIPPVRPALPKNSDSDHPIDAFVNATLQKRAIQPVGAADKWTAIRRLKLDATGLPPTSTEIQQFLSDDANDAWGRLVDRTLASPHFGERLAVYWLDLVRYADSVGYHKDSHRDCWLYRDYVIDAFNENKPYDQFVTEQLAGDLLKGDKFQQIRWKIASGFNRMNQTTSEGGAQAKEYLAKYSADRVRNTAAIFLGTTMGCSECHDHKYDPFTAVDFYNFAAFFADLQERGVGYPKHVPMPDKQQILQWKRIEAQLEETRAGRDQAAADQRADWDKKIKELEARHKKITDTKGWNKTLVTIAGKPRPIRFLARGNWLDDSGPIAVPEVPQFLGSIRAKDRRGTRLDLANWIVDRNNPLTARVFVNRLWKIFFGEGICRTLDDLGSQGEWPSHPELLDWLAIEFIESGWNIKHMVRLMVTSDAYQRSSLAPRSLVQNDPENRWLARQARFRLPAEFVRDNALEVSGLLTRKVGGPSVRPYQPKNYWFRLYKDAKYPTSQGEDQYRRGLYSYWRRSFWHPSLRAFDAPAREECVARRPRSNTPQQSLVLLNDPTYLEAAWVFAAQLLELKLDGDDERLAYAFRKATSRSPDTVEISLLRNLLNKQRERYRQDRKAAQELVSVGNSKLPAQIEIEELAAWATVTRTLLNLHETITRN